MIGVQSSVGAVNFSLQYLAHPASYAMGTGSSFPGAKAVGA